MAVSKKYIIKATKDDIIIDNADLMDMAAVATNLLHRVAQEMGAKMIAHSEDGDFTIKIITSKKKGEQKMNELKCEKVERELELNGQKAKFVASTLNLDYVIIDKTLYLGLDCYDKVIKDVRAEFASDEAITKRAERIVAANAAFEFVCARMYGELGEYKIAVYVKEKFGYVALHTSDNLLYVQFAWGTNFGQDKINKIPTMDMEENCKTNIEKYKEQLSNTYQDRYSNFVWFQDRYKDEQFSHTRDVSVEECCEVSFIGACLHCGEIIDYSFSVDESRITECKECGAVFSVFTEVIATATHNIKRIR